MAGDWIPIRVNLHEDDAVFGIAEELNVHPLQVVGMMIRLWSWSSEQTRNGCASNVTYERVDALVGCKNFSKAMEKQGWLARKGSGIRIPKWNKYLSNAAKKRALARNRMKRIRCASSATPAQPQNRTEEKSIKNPPTPQRGEPSVCERIYQAYPKHVGKGAALRAIKAALKKIPSEKLLPKVQAFTESVAHKRGTPDWQYVPHPATWFNQGRWDDDPSETKHGNKNDRPSRRRGSEGQYDFLDGRTVDAS